MSYLEYSNIQRAFVVTLTQNHRINILFKKIRPKIHAVIKLYFGDHLKRAVT